MEEMLLSLIRKPNDEQLAKRLYKLSKTDAMKLLALASKVKVLPPISKQLINASNSAVVEVAQSALAQNSMRVREQIAALKLINEKAEKEFLRFVLVKGLSAADRCHDDLFARQAGDIDILVATEDVAKCDFVLKEAGFCQPPPTIGAHFHAHSLKQAAQYKSRSNSVFPLRRKMSGNQLCPYYSSELGVKIEAHDGIYGIPRSEIPSLLWATKMKRLGPVSVRTFTPEVTLAVLIATTFQNSENVYSLLDGDPNLRDYVDLRAFFTKFNNNNFDLSEFNKLITDCQLSAQVGAVLNNYAELFPGENFLLGSNASATQPTTKMPSIRSRIFDKATTHSWAVNEIRKCVAESKSGLLLLSKTARTNEWLRFENDLRLNIQYKIDQAEENIIISWRLPASLTGELPGLGFQIGITPVSDHEYLQFLIGARFEGDTPVGCCDKVSRPNQMLSCPPNKNVPYCSLEKCRGFLILQEKLPLKVLNLDAQEFNDGIGITALMFRRYLDDFYQPINEKDDEFITFTKLTENRAANNR